jgi:hypothetical protein
MGVDAGFGNENPGSVDRAECDDVGADDIVIHGAMSARGGAVVDGEHGGGAGADRQFVVADVIGVGDVPGVRQPVFGAVRAVRSLQLGSAVAIVAMAVAALGWWPALVASALLLGVELWADAAVGEPDFGGGRRRRSIVSLDLLDQTGGARRRGVGGADRGAGGGGVRVELGVAAGGGGGGITLVALNPLRAMMDVERDKTRSIHPAG